MELARRIQNKNDYAIKKVYNENGKLSLYINTETDETTEYKYNEYGNISKVITIANGIKEREVEIIYNNKNRISERYTYSRTSDIVFCVERFKYDTNNREIEYIKSSFTDVNGLDNRLDIMNYIAKSLQKIKPFIYWEERNYDNCDNLILYRTSTGIESHMEYHENGKIKKLTSKNTKTSTIYDNKQSLIIINHSKEN